MALRQAGRGSENSQILLHNFLDGTYRLLLLSERLISDTSRVEFTQKLNKNKKELSLLSSVVPVTISAAAVIIPPVPVPGKASIETA